MLAVCALLLAVQVGDLPVDPAGDPPPPPTAPATPPPLDEQEPQDTDGAEDDAPIDDTTPPPDERVPPPPDPPRPVSPLLSAFVGAVGAGAGAIAGAVPAAMVGMSGASSEDEALLTILALTVLPSAAAIGAGMLAVILVVDKPTLEDVAGVVLCAGLSCVGAVAGALLVGLGAGGGCGGGGGGGSCGSCGSGNCNDPTGGDPLESPAVSHAGGAALGAIVGICAGVAVIAVEIDATPRVRQEAITIGALVGAGAGVVGAVLGGTIGGFIGADAEETRRIERGPHPR